MSGGNPVGAFVSFWMFLQLLGVLTSLMGGIYALFCLSRIASGVHRVADALEMQAQNATQAESGRNVASMQQFAPTLSPIANVPPAPPDDTSSTQSATSPTFTEHDVRPRNDSF